MVAPTSSAPRLVINDRSLPLLPKQDKFLRTRGRYPAYIGGLGSGKSHVLIRKAVEACALNRGRAGIYACLTNPLLKKAILPEFRKVMYGYGLVEGLDWTINRTDMIAYLHCFSDDSGEPAQIFFIPVEGPGNLSRLIGFNAAWACCDEAGSMTEDAHRRVSERVRDKRSRAPFIASATTPEGLNWLYDRYVVEPRERAASAGVEGGVVGDEDWRYVRGRTEDNPHVDAGYVESLRSRYPEHLIDAYLNGEFVPLFDGLCFRFSDRENVSAEAEYDPSLPLELCCDFNINPMSWAVGHYYQGQFLIFDEIVLANARTEDACLEFLDRFWNTDRPHQTGVTVYGDASGRARSTKAHGTDYDIIADYLREMPGFRELVPAANPTHRNRVNETNAVLKNGHGEVNLLVNPRCTETIRSFQTTKWDDKSRGAQIEKNQDSYEHLTDAIGYWIHQRAPIQHSLAAGRPQARRSSRAAA